MIKDTKEKLDVIASEYICPEHPDKVLTVAWHPDKFYVIRCGAGHYPEEITRPKTPSAQVAGGPVGDAWRVEELLPRADLETGEALTPQVIKHLVAYAQKYGLDPYRGHVVIMHGRPYIGLDGYLFYANLTRIPYQLRSRPLSPDDRMTYLIDPGSHAWTCEVIRVDTGASFTGLGVVTADEITAKSKRHPENLRSPVVAAHPWLLAQKRAEWQAMRRAFPIGEEYEKDK